MKAFLSGASPCNLLAATKMESEVNKFFSILVLVALVSCGESPLFNHVREGVKEITNGALTDSEAVRFSKSGYSFAVKWMEGPALGTSRFIMRSWKTDTGSINGPYTNFPNTLNVFLWMPAMGHGSAPVKIKSLGDGEYEVSEVQFIMGGKWEVKFQLKNGNAVVDEVVVPVSL